MTLRAMRHERGFRKNIGWVGLTALLVVCAGCGTGPGTTPTIAPDPGTPTQEAEPEPVQLERQRVLSLLDEVADVDAAGLAERYPAAFAEAPSYTAESLQGLALIQGSSLALNETELAALTRKGFVISDRLSFPSFAYGYQNIYADDLPVYVSADSILDAIHRSYEDIFRKDDRAVRAPERRGLGRFHPHRQSRRRELAPRGRHALRRSKAPDARIRIARTDPRPVSAP